MSSSCGQDKAEPLAFAQGYVRASISCIPVARDGSKAPAWQLLPEVWDELQGKYRRVWTVFQRRLPTEAEIREWFDRPDPPGIAVVCGSISGNMELLDFDNKAEEIFSSWCDIVEGEVPGLLARLTVNTTPRGGYHTWF